MNERTTKICLDANLLLGREVRFHQIKYCCQSGPGNDKGGNTAEGGSALQKAACSLIRILSLAYHTASKRLRTICEEQTSVVDTDRG